MSKTSNFVPPVVYDAYGPKQPRKPQVFVGPSMTRQEFKDNGNLDVIVDNFTRGIPIPGVDDEPVFGDVSRVPSYQEAQNVILKADRLFNELPAKVRKRLKSPAELMEFLSNPENEDEARKLGLLKAVEEPVIAKATSSSPSTEGAPGAPVGAPKGGSEGKGA